MWIWSTPKAYYLSLLWVKYIPVWLNRYWCLLSSNHFRLLKIAPILTLCGVDHMWNLTVWEDWKLIKNSIIFLGKLLINQCLCPSLLVNVVRTILFFMICFMIYNQLKPSHYSNHFVNEKMDLWRCLNGPHCVLVHSAPTSVHFFPNGPPKQLLSSINTKNDASLSFVVQYLELEKAVLP